jgi:Ca2+-binding RTX toxin-like protein
VTITATDSDGAATSTSFALIVNNVAPSIAADNASVTVDEAQTAMNRGTFGDPGLDTLGLTASIGVVTDNGDGTWSWSFGTNDGPDQTQTVTITATDSDGAATSTTFALIVNNVAPSIAADNAAVTVDEAQTAANTGTFGDPGLDTLGLAASVGVVTDNGNGKWSWSFATNDGPDQTQTVTITATDSDGAATSTTFALIVDNVAPSIAADNASVTVDEAETAMNRGTFGDPGLDTLGLAASIGVVTDNGDGTWSWSFGTNDGPDQTQTVTITATDSDGAATSTSFALIVNNVAPEITAVVSSNETPCGSSPDGEVTISGAFADPGWDAHIVTVNWGDGKVEDVSVDQAADTFAGVHVYADGGIYTVAVTVTDSDGAVSQAVTTQAVVQGVGLVDGVLYVIGTPYDDDIHIHEQRHGDRITVDVRLGSPPHGDGHRGCGDHGSDGGQGGEHRDRIRETFAASEVDLIVVYACAGDDHVDIGGGSDGGGDCDGHGGSDGGSDGGRDIEIDAMIFGGEGDDYLRSAHGNDYLDGGAGNDRIYSRGGHDTIFDLSGDNSIWSGEGDDTIVTGDGDDRIYTDGGNDTIDAGGGDNDIWSGDGDDVVTAGDGHDGIHTDGGNDTIHAGGGNNDIWSGRGDDTITTGDGNDDIHTDGGNDVIAAGGGRNRIWSGEGDDTITTGDGDDEVHADGGNDVIQAGDGRNRIWSGEGDDTVITGSGNDEIHADGGNDVILAGAGNDDIDAGSGNDIVVAGDGDDHLVGGSGRDLLIGGSGSDWICGDAADDILIAGSTDYDANVAALKALLAEWSSGASYPTRVANVTRGGGSLVGLGVLLNDTTVHDDSDYDELRGDGDRDLFFYNFEGAGTKDKAKDIKLSGGTAETRVDID